MCTACAVQPTGSLKPVAEGPHSRPSARSSVLWSNPVSRSFLFIDPRLSVLFHQPDAQKMKPKSEVKLKGNKLHTHRNQGVRISQNSIYRNMLFCLQINSGFMDCTAMHHYCRPLYAISGHNISILLKNKYGTSNDNILYSFVGYSYKMFMSNQGNEYIWQNFLIFQPNLGKL